VKDPFSLQQHRPAEAKLPFVVNLSEYFLEEPTSGGSAEGTLSCLSLIFEQITHELLSFR
jgi:hypothetical protein